MGAMLTQSQACKYLSIGRSTFYRLINKDPDFPAYKIGGVWRIDTAELDDWKYSQRKERSKGQEPIVIKRRPGRPTLSGTRPEGH